MPSSSSLRPVLRVALGLLPCRPGWPASVRGLATSGLGVTTCGLAQAAPATVAQGGVELSPWTLGATLLALCALALWRWFRRLPDEVGRAGGWPATLRDVALRNGAAAVVAWQLGAGVFRGVLARYPQADDAMGLRVAMPIALAAATVGFLVARWLMVFVQRAWRRRRGLRA